MSLQPNRYSRQALPPKLLAVRLNYLSLFVQYRLNIVISGGVSSQKGQREKDTKKKWLIESDEGKVETFYGWLKRPGWFVILEALAERRQTEALLSDFCRPTSVSRSHPFCCAVSVLCVHSSIIGSCTQVFRNALATQAFRHKRIAIAIAIALIGPQEATNG